MAGNNLEAFKKTTRAMESISEMMKKERVDTIVIATPHNLRLKCNIGVILTEFTEGNLRTENGAVQIRLECDRALGADILQKA